MGTAPKGSAVSLAALRRFQLGGHGLTGQFPRGRYSPTWSRDFDISKYQRLLPHRGEWKDVLINNRSISRSRSIADQRYAVGWSGRIRFGEEWVDAPEMDG